MKEYDLLEKLKNLEKQGAIPLDKLFNKSFIKKKTIFEDYEEFLKKSPVLFNSVEEFKTIDKELLNEFISKNTDYLSWQDMINEASKIYMENKILI